MFKLKLKIFLFLICLFSITTQASFPEFFGTGPTTSTLGNQANSDHNDPANLYYIPALAAWGEKVVVGATMSATTHNFEDIKGIITENSTTGQSGQTTVTGDANTNYEDSINTSINLLFPLRDKDLGAIGLSFFAPVGRLTETNSGSPKLPEYSLYRTRYRRTQLYFNYALPLGENWAISAGAHLGFQVSARVNTQVSLSNNYGSSGSAKTKIDPSLGAILSLAHRDQDSLSYFTFQQEMKSNLEAIATGDISDPPLTLINLSLESMIYYDPHILRIGHSRDFGLFELFGSLEYQMWENYKAPVIRVNNLGGTVKASDRFESLNLRSIFVPKIGVLYHLTDPLGLRFGLSYRQSPFDSDFSGAGNTIDADVFMASSGLTYDFKFFQKDIQVGLSVQYHRLSEKTVTKTSGQENGATGVKIGSPSFKVGGNVLMAMGGLKVAF
ncbi:MAG: outer membrane protein transport protein [Bacteriovoracaceae bacterium]|nr:outer membrane protein transport protein [Bacteriovoracaceae bacterium]